MGVWAAFKKFLFSGSLISMAIAFVVGLAIVALITALVTDIIDPLIGAAGGTNFSSIGVLTINGSSLLGGALLGSVINFLILMVVVFFLIAYPYQISQDRKSAKATATTRPCPECLTMIPIAATRCSACTATVPPYVPPPPAAPKH
jgi:large conductance mechanosensitive channel